MPRKSRLLGFLSRESSCSQESPPESPRDTQQLLCDSSPDVIAYQQEASPSLSEPDTGNHSEGKNDRKYMARLQGEEQADIGDLVEIAFSEITLVQKLGEGGFGVVYRGTRHNQNVAVKQLQCQQMGAETEEDFLKEARIMWCSRQHSHIVHLYGVCRKPYALVMELVEKGSLYDILHVLKEELSNSLKYKIALDIANALAFLHSQAPPIVHCDLKSPNVLLDSNYNAKLTDFGMSGVRRATVVSSYEGHKPAREGRWTAPESIRDGSYTKACDVYSYAQVLWEILTNTLPFHSIIPCKLIHAVAIINFREDIPQNSLPILAELIEKCWGNDPSERLDMSTVVNKLRQNPVEVLAPMSVSQTVISSGLGYPINTEGHESDFAGGGGRGFPVASNSSSFFQPATNNTVPENTHEADSTAVFGQG